MHERRSAGPYGVSRVARVARPAGPWRGAGPGGWSVALATLVALAGACGGRIAPGDDAGGPSVASPATDAGAATGTPSTGSGGSGGAASGGSGGDTTSFPVCPDDAPVAGSRCAMPPDQGCRYAVLASGQWSCRAFVCAGGAWTAAPDGC